MTHDEEQFRDLERRRTDAIAAGDVDALRGILAEDYTHIHASGKIDDRETHIASMAKSRRGTERGEVTVRQYGDTALLTGELVNLNRDGRKNRYMCQQVAVKSGGAWRFVSFQNCGKTDV